MVANPKMVNERGEDVTLTDPIQNVDVGKALCRVRLVIDGRGFFKAEGFAKLYYAQWDESFSPPNKGHGYKLQARFEDGVYLTGVLADPIGGVAGTKPEAPL